MIKVYKYYTFTFISSSYRYWWPAICLLHIRCGFASFLTRSGF